MKQSLKERIEAMETKKLAAEIMCKTCPDVEVTLKVVKGCRTWVIAKCPFCGHEHTHGAGTGDNDKRLGLRVAHCIFHDCPEYRDANYTLVEKKGV